MTKQKKRARKATPPTPGGVARVVTGSFCCSVCDESVSTVDLLQCKVCQASYHPSCANMEVEVFCVLQPILPAVGWVCPECVSTISDRRKNIDDQFESLNNAVQRLENSQQKLIEKVENLSAPVSSVSRSVGAFSGSSGRLSTNLTRSDQSYCKKNVIISGFPESTDVSDAD